MPPLKCNEVRASLEGFWRSVLECEPTTDGGLAVAMPLNYPDDWQIIVEVKPFAEKQVLLSDGGRTLGRFFASGQNYDSSAKGTHTLLRERLERSRINVNGLELWQNVPLPVNGLDLHVFAEALSAIAYLEYRHDATAQRDSPVRRSVGKLLGERRMEFNESAKLDGVISHQVEVDFLVNSKKPIAIQSINRGGRIKDFMEQWGFRWNDLTRRNANLLPVMIYDSDRQTIDPQSKQIGKDVCELFCPYQELHRLQDLIDRVEESDKPKKRGS